MEHGKANSTKEGSGTIRVERTFYPDGRPKEEIPYRGVSPHGRWRQWHPNGQLAGEWWLDRGVYLNGTNRTWYPNGQLQSECRYVNGKLIDEVQYTPAGKTRPSLAEQQRRRILKMATRARGAKSRRTNRIDPAEAARARAFVEELLGGHTADARVWLSEAAEGSERTLGEMNGAVSREFVRVLLELGAPTVRAVKIEAIPGGDDQTANHVLVGLPGEVAVRVRVLAFVRAWQKEQGFEPEADGGGEWAYLGCC